MNGFTYNRIGHKNVEIGLIAEDVQKIYIKMDNFEKKIEKILIEKDYIIDNLRDELSELKSENKELSQSLYSSNKNDYFY